MRQNFYGKNEITFLECKWYSCCAKKGFIDWLLTEDPDILCLQETKAAPEQLSEELLNINGYKSYFSSSIVKKGYSGVAIYTKLEPIKVEHGFGIPKFDDEGRIIIADYKDFVLLNIYYPNGKRMKNVCNTKWIFTMPFWNTQTS